MSNKSPHNDLSLPWHYIEKWARTQPQAEALAFNDDRISWEEFGALVDKTAKAFLELGIDKGDRVAFLGMARNEFLITFMAAAKVGAIWLGLSPKFSVDELGYMLHDSSPKLLIAIREYQGKDLAHIGADMVERVPSLESVLIIGDAVSRARNFSEFVNLPRANLDAQLEDRAQSVLPADPALLMYTSGSTGHPKGVVHTHKSIVANAQTEVRHLDLHPGDRLLLHFPVNHVAADVEIGLSAICSGSAVVSMDRFDPEESLKTIASERITLVGQIPSMYLLQMQRPIFKETDWSHVKAFVWSGAPAPKVLVDTLAGIVQETGARLISGYGMTETAGFVTYTAPDDPPPITSATAGKAPEAFELRIVDAHRREVPDGHVGQIAVHGDIVMKEYWRNADATAAVLDADGWFYTGDLASKDAAGYITIAGRTSEMYKTGGENVFPREVEAVIEIHPAVLAVAVVAVPDAIYTEVGAAFVVPKPNCTLTDTDLRAHCHQHLANFKVPKQFHFRDAMPHLPNGKIDRRTLHSTLAYTEHGWTRGAK